MFIVIIIYTITNFIWPMFLATLHMTISLLVQSAINQILYVCVSCKQKLLHFKSTSHDVYFLQDSESHTNHISDSSSLDEDRELSRRDLGHRASSSLATAAVWLHTLLE